MEANLEIVIHIFKEQTSKYQIWKNGNVELKTSLQEQYRHSAFQFINLVKLFLLCERLKHLFEK